MTRPRRTGIAIALVVLTLATEARGDVVVPEPGEMLHLKTPVTGRTDGGTDLRLPPGYFFDELAFGKVDAEMRRLEDAETRTRAENDSLRKSLDSWSPGWITLSATLISGFLLGAYAHSKI